jgi:hypothetical protein
MPPKAATKAKSPSKLASDELWAVDIKEDHSAAKKLRKSLPQAGSSVITEAVPSAAAASEPARKSSKLGGIVKPKMSNVVYIGQYVDFVRCQLLFPDQLASVQSSTRLL